jgi:hypothetical protein
LLQLIDTTISNLLAAALQPPVLPELPHIYFMTPDSSFPGSAELPALNLFLFSMQENRDLRRTDSLRQRMPDRTISVARAPVRVDCHYLVTAYAKVPETQPLAPFDEHWLLGETMRALLRFSEIPSLYWADPSVSVEGLPLQAEAALPATREMGIDLWQALGQKPRACFHYKVTANVDLKIAPVVSAPVSSVVLVGADE